MTYIHLPTKQKGTVFWDPDMVYGSFMAENGTCFTIHETEVISEAKLNLLKERAKRASAD